MHNKNSLTSFIFSAECTNYKSGVTSGIHTVPNEREVSDYAKLTGVIYSSSQMLLT